MSAIDLLIPAPLADRTPRTSPEPSRVESADLDERPAFRDELGRAARPAADRSTAAPEPDVVDAPAGDASPTASESAAAEQAGSEAPAPDAADTRAAQGDASDAAPASDAPVDPVVAEAQQLVAAFAGRTQPLREAPEVISAAAPQAITGVPDPASTVATSFPLATDLTTNPTPDPTVVPSLVTPAVAVPTAPVDPALNQTAAGQPQRTVLQAASAVSATDARATANPGAIVEPNSNTSAPALLAAAETDPAVSASRIDPTLAASPTTNNAGSVVDPARVAAQVPVETAESSRPAPTPASTTASSAPALATPVAQGPATAPAPAAAAAAPGAVNPEADAEGLNAARLSRALNSAVKQNGGGLTLRLTPPELGTVRINLQLQGASVSADFVAESEAGGRLLSRQLGQLRTALEGQGLNVERLGVQTKGQAFAGGSGTQSEGQSTRQDNASGQARSGSPDAGEGRSRGRDREEAEAEARRNTPAAERDDDRGFRSRLFGEN